MYAFTCADVGRDALRHLLPKQRNQPLVRRRSVFLGHSLDRLEQIQRRVETAVRPRRLPPGEHRLDAADHTIVARNLDRDADLLQALDQHVVVEDRRKADAGADQLETGAVECVRCCHRENGPRDWCAASAPAASLPGTDSSVRWLRRARPGSGHRCRYSAPRRSHPGAPRGGTEASKRFCRVRRPVQQVRARRTATSTGRSAPAPCGSGLRF